jgi:predicted  nucleic acid-binding Zn-ribbon protein
MISTAEDYKKMKDENRNLSAELHSLREEYSAEKSSLENLLKDFDSYKDKYRAHVRDKIRDTEIAKLETLSGDAYENITVTEVTPVGIQIRHAYGTKRIPYENLPKDMQDYLQFDERQKADALEKESADLDAHIAEVSSSESIRKANSAVDQARSSEDTTDKITQTIALKNGQVTKLESEVVAMQQEIVSEENKKIKRYEAGSRVGGLSRAPAIRLEIQKKERQITALRQQIVQLNQMLEKQP